LFADPQRDLPSGTQSAVPASSRSRVITVYTD
jgi:hypothetical protein